MNRVIVDSYPEGKWDCPFCSLSSHGACRLKEESYNTFYNGGISGCRWVNKCCDAFSENDKFDKEKCGMLIEIGKYVYEEKLKEKR